MPRAKILAPIGLAVLILLTIVPPANAGSAVMRLVCTGTTVCNEVTVGGTTLFLTSSGLPTFNVTNVGNTGLANGEVGTAFLVVAVPNTAPLLNFTANGLTPSFEGNWNDPTKLLSQFLGLTLAPGAGVDPVLNPFLSAANGVLPLPIDGFDIYVINLGAYTEDGSIPVSFAGIAGFPAGTFFWVYLTNSQGVVIDTTPISQTVMVPEPSTLTLLGVGLVSILGLAAWRRRLPF